MLIHMKYKNSENRRKASHQHLTKPDLDENMRADTKVCPPPTEEGSES